MTNLKRNRNIHKNCDVTKNNMLLKYDVLIIGAGVSGSSVYNELKKQLKNNSTNKNDLKIGIVEMGGLKPEYVIEKEENNVETIYAKGIGGAGSYFVGNALEVSIEGLNLEEEYEELKKELNISVVPEECLSRYEVELINKGFKQTPKLINFDKCVNCGLCAHKGCEARAYFYEFLDVTNDEVKESEIILNSKVIDVSLNEQKNYKFEVILENNVNITNNNTNSNNNTNNNNNNNNNNFSILAKNIVLCAGGVNSPRILSKLYAKENITSEDLGKNLFIDSFVTVGGVLIDSNINKEVPMAIYKDYGNYILSSHYSELLYNRILEESEKDIKIKKSDVFGFMIKIKDSENGTVSENSIYKPMSEKDVQTFMEAMATATPILRDLGINKVYSTIPRGSHPSGTCKLGKVVNKKFETPIKNLYICDASILPESIGKPPILALMALSKKLSKSLINNLKN
ncbi:NAD-dependent dihydropyrimidine dehydrogenase PreA subunit [Methanococcus voltae]|uniref:GMC oxidoreductase n=1 Tax=Methanococcus voltae TaxID=2188 RepID=UPI001AE41592|nr:GMC oxidoreductase [Methanococcus voltae]MBP2143712.1 NAD-dependent dihydropyrimidine dehydrogenase PreA subunit [Methanococcus voltae]